MARTHARIDPKRIECGPAAFVAVMPPIVQNAPLDGSTGNRKPCLRAAASTSARNAPGPTLTIRDATSTPAMSRHRLRSTIDPLADRAARHAAARTPRDQRQRALSSPNA